MSNINLLQYSSMWSSAEHTTFFLLPLTRHNLDRFINQPYPPVVHILPSPSIMFCDVPSQFTSFLYLTFFSLSLPTLSFYLCFATNDTCVMLGTRLVVTLLHGMKRTGKRYGVVSLCIGTGMGAAAVYENPDYFDEDTTSQSRQLRNGKYPQSRL